MVDAALRHAEATGCRCTTPPDVIIHPITGVALVGHDLGCPAALAPVTCVPVEARR